MAAVYAGFALATVVWQAWALFGVYGIYFGLTEGSERALVADLVSASRRGAAFGWYNLATGLGLQLDRLVLLSWPVHEAWFPDFDRLQRIIDIRVHLDLVILADGGGQTFTPPPAAAGKVSSHVNGWFHHADTHNPDYWERHGLPAVL